MDKQVVESCEHTWISGGMSGYRCEKCKCLGSKRTVGKNAGKLLPLKCEVMNQVWKGKATACGEYAVGVRARGESFKRCCQGHLVEGRKRVSKV
jgi:hypothetical protein